ncbi:MAG: hypothetical protein PHP74_00070 [Candidatus Gracilibacteria bacterium]|nr:hypothetical protein [Candidatus Gracilibacteria bacterium]
MTKENLHTALQAKETEIQKAKKLSKKDQAPDIVDEEKVKTKIEVIDRKLVASPLSDKYKKPIYAKLKYSEEEWRKKVEEIDEKEEEKFIKLFEEIEKDFENFESRKDVKEIFECVEPLFNNKNEVEKIINLKSYSRRSEDWEKITKSFSAMNFDEVKIKGLQKILGLTIDGKAGPETIIGINEKVYEQSFEVKWGKSDIDIYLEAVFFGDLSEKEMLEFNEEGKIIDEEWGKDLKKSKTIADILKAEKKAMDAMAALNEKFSKNKQTLIKEEVLDPDEEQERFLEQQEKESIEMEQYYSQFARIAHGIGLTSVETHRNGMETSQAREYWYVFLQEPYNEENLNGGKVDLRKRISVKEVEETINKMRDYYKEFIPEKELNRMLQEVFGKMINGQRINLDTEEMLSLRTIHDNDKAEEFRKSIEEKNKIIEKTIEREKEKLKKLAEEMEILQKEKDAIVVAISREVSRNPDWYNIFKDSKEGSIKSLVWRLTLIDADINGLKGKGEAIEKTINNAISRIFENEYEWIKYATVDPITGEIDEEQRRNFLLQIGGGMGEENIPLSLMGAFIDAKTYVSQDPDASEFDKLFYSGKYSEALASLAEASEKRNEVEDGVRKFSSIDVFRAYKKQMGEEGGWIIPETAKYIQEGFTLVEIEHPGSWTKSYFLAKENDDGSFEYIQVNLVKQVTHGGTPETEMTRLSRMRHERSYDSIFFSNKIVVPREKLSEQLETDIYFRGNMAKLISTKPSFKATNKAGELLDEKFGPMFKFFQAGMIGSKPVDFVRKAKVYAREIKSSASGGALYSIKKDLENLKNDLALLKSFQVGFRDDLELKLESLSDQLTKMLPIFEGNKIENFCNEILSDNFSEDTAGKWFVETGIPFFTTIALAVGAVLLTAGTGGIGGLAIATLSGTVGGMIGNELGTLASQYVGRAVGLGEGFTNKTILGKSLTGEGVFNPETGEYEHLEWYQVAEAYGANFLIGFISTFALMGAGQAAGKFLSKWAVEASTSRNLLERTIAKGLQKIPKLGEVHIDIGSKKFINKFAKELFEESMEEGVEEAAMRVNEGLGFIARFYNCLNGRRVRHNLGGFAVVNQSSTQIDSKSEAVWTYNARDAESFRATLEAKYGSQGFTITQNSEGDFVARSEFVHKRGKNKGKKSEIEMIFKASAESHSMRQMFVDGIDAEGKSEIERFYGVSKIQGRDNEYSFKSLYSKGKVDLPKYLKMRGFIITEGDPKSGNFTATKGVEKVVFKGKSQSEITAENEAQKAIEVHDEVQQQLEEQVEMESISSEAKAEEAVVQIDREVQNPKSVVSPKKIKIKPLTEISEISQLQEWISSPESQISNPESINESIRNYESTGNKKYLMEIPIEGGLRGKVFELIEARNKQATIDRIKAEEAPTKIELAEDIKISESTDSQAKDSAAEWLIDDVADENHGTLLVQETADNFIDSKPQKLTMNFKNGNRITILFPSKYKAKMDSLMNTFLQMETWIQTQFEQQGIFMKENLTILIVEDVPGVKPVRGGANFGRILIPARNLFSESGETLNDGLRTYLHERTHSVLTTARIKPDNSGIVEGIAVYMPIKGMSELGLESPGKGAAKGIELEVLDRVKYEGKTLQEAFWEYFGMDGVHDIANYGLNYQYGYAFTEAFIRHFDGDFKKYMDLYRTLSSQTYDGYEHMGALFLNAMMEMEIDESQARMILGEASGVMILQGLSGNQLFDHLGQMAVEDIAVIIGKGQSLEAIFDVDLATTAELSSYVSEAKKYITSKFGENSVEGNFIIKILESKLHQRYLDAGVIEQSTRVITGKEAIEIFEKAESALDVDPEVLISLPVDFINGLTASALGDVVFAKKLFGIDPQIKIDPKTLNRKFKEFKSKFVTELVERNPESINQSRALMRLANAMNDVIRAENEAQKAIEVHDEVQQQLEEQVEMESISSEAKAEEAIPKLETDEAKAIMRGLEGEGIPIDYIVFAIISPHNIFTGQDLIGVADRINFAKQLKENNSKGLDAFNSDVVRVVKKFIKDGTVIDPQQENGSSSSFDLRSTESAYFKSKYGLTDYAYRLLHLNFTTYNDSYPQEIVEFFKDGIFKIPPQQSAGIRYSIGREIQLPIRGKMETFKIVETNIRGLNGENLLIVNGLVGGINRNIEIDSGYIEKYNTPTRVENTRTIIANASSYVLKTVDSVLLGSSLAMATLKQFGVVRPIMIKGRLYMVVYPRAKISTDPKQPADNYTGTGNRYFLLFKRLKDEGRKMITPSDLEQLGLEVPYVSIDMGGNMEYRDHHRIWGAMDARIPIVVNVVRNMVTFN